MSKKSEKNYMFSYLWRVIANNYLDPVEEYNFDKELGRKHRFDFAFPEKKVAVEIEGNAWHVKGGGKHMQDRDLEKYNIAAVLGWRVLRFSPAMLENDPMDCIQTVRDCLRSSK